MKKLIKLSLLLLTIHLSLVGIFAQTEQKAELVVQLGSSDSISCLAFSPNAKYIISGDWLSNIIILWDVKNGKELRRFVSSTGNCKSLTFSHDGEFIAASFEGGKLYKWEAKSGKEILAIETDSAIKVTFSIDDRKIITGHNDSMKSWDSYTGKLLNSENFLVNSFSTTGNFAFVSNPNTKVHAVFEISNWKLKNLIKGGIGKIKISSFSENESEIYFILVNEDNELISFDIQTQNLQNISSNLSSRIGYETKQGEIILPQRDSYFYECDSKTNYKEGEKIIENNVCSINYKTGDFGKMPISNNYLDYSNPIFVMTTSKDGKYLAAGGNDGTTTIWELSNETEISWLAGKFSWISEIILSGNNLLCVTDEGLKINWNLVEGKAKLVNKGRGQGSQNLKNKLPLVSSNQLYRLEKRTDGNKVILLNNQTNNIIKELNGHKNRINYAEFSTDNRVFITSDLSGELRLWNTETGEIMGVFLGHQGAILDIEFVNDGKILISGGMDSTIRLWDIKSGKEKAKLLSSNDAEWIVINPDGLFDASPNARKLMHYVIGLEPIALEQMKDLYYVPNLLQKIFKGEPLPKVELFSKKDLFPSVEYQPLKPNQKQLTVKLTNRGGGIGQVQIKVNDKEFIADARPKGFNPNSPNAVLTVDLSSASIKAGEENKIEIVAKNMAGSLSTLGTKGSEVVYLDDGKKQVETPNIYVIAGGVSDYTGNGLDLKFAAKDAEDFAKTIEIGAVKLLGDKSKVHIRLLTSNGDKSTVKFDVPDAKIFPTASKPNFEQAFADFKNATPNDVFIVYLSGHGVSLNLNQNPNQAGGDTYLYLTQEATTTDKSVLAIENSRKAMAISSEELKDLMKQNKALKQVLILDTCAAGKAAESFVQKKDLPDDDARIRAIERLKDNTGFFVLMGSSADAVSYEASQYGQGLLTYSLLQGMKGAKLRENQFADVNLLFGYAQETVPNMAKNIGGIQRPLIITPDTSASFDIGKFTGEEQKLIQLSNPKPVILRPNLRNSALRFDNLKLSQMMTEQLRQASYVETRGDPTRIVFVEADEMTDAVQPVGDYTVEGETLKISVVLVRNNEQVGKEITVTGKVSEAEKVIKQLIEAVTNTATTEAKSGF